MVAGAGVVGHLTLHLPAHQDLDHAPRYPLPGSLPHAQARLAHVGRPLPHLIDREVHQVELEKSTRSNILVEPSVVSGGWCSIHTTDRSGQSMIADDLRGEL